MVKKPNPSRRIHPQKTYSKEFNLLRPGTGIRFMPQQEWGRPGKNMTAPLRLALLMLLLGGAAGLYLNLPAPPPARRAAAVRLAPPPRIMREEAVTANAAPVVDMPVRQEAPAAEQTADTAATGQTAPRWRIRFGIFILRENAEHHAQSLAKKGVIAAAETALRPMSAFTLKAGPVTNAVAWKELKAAGEKLNVAPMAEVDGKYLVVGPIWLKDRALAAEKHFGAAGVRTEIVEERKDREVFKVVSAPFETAEAAKRAIGEMKTNGIEGVIDE